MINLTSVYIYICSNNIDKTLFGGRDTVYLLIILKF